MLVIGRRLIGVLALLMIAPPSFAASTINCIVNMGHLCVADNCKNVAKAEQVTIDLANSTYRSCYVHESKLNCSTVKMLLDTEKDFISGTTVDAKNISMRMFLLSPFNGKLTTIMGSTSAHVSTVDFGSCDIQ